MIHRLKKWLRKKVSRKQINYLHKARAIWANFKFSFPAKGMIFIGVTGTKGKTTTCHFLASILEEAGYKVGMATTVSFKIGSEVVMNDTNKSVIPPLQLQGLIRQMKDAHCDIVILEATSIGLDQHRLWGIPFQYAGFTNLAHDHLDYHGDWDHYQNAKLKLFKMRSLKAVCANVDDPAGLIFLKETYAKQRWSYSLESADAPVEATEHIYADKISTNMNGASFSLHAEGEETRVLLQLPGKFSIENALCAAGIGFNFNLKLKTIADGLESLAQVPGRLDKIETKKGYSVIVDYAHTPDSLEKLYSTLRPEVRGRMIAVLGSCGDRDRTKRPIMGALAGRFCDNVFITDEEPYTEDPLEIMEEVARGVPRGRALYKPSQSIAQKQKQVRPIFKQIDSETGEGDWWWKIVDRREAISRAIDLCKMDDLVLVTGMGSQNFKIVGSEQIPWNDKKVVEAILSEKHLV